MATIVTRAGKGSPLTSAELDANFNNLNNDTGGGSSPFAVYDSWKVRHQGPLGLNFRGFRLSISRDVVTIDNPMANLALFNQGVI